MSAIYDIAKLSESSAATVSYVLNGRGGREAYFQTDAGEDLGCGAAAELPAERHGPDSFCRFMTPSVTTIDLRIQEVFEQGLKILPGIISRHEDPNTVTVIPPRYVYRESISELLT
jgi:DNA-binding LacI/PurR family transcriptional regulator